jgi:Na+/proline symporter
MDTNNLGGQGNCLDKHFLAQRSLKPRLVSQILCSTSFGVNAILYAVWLGYVMGMWAILIHIGWCLSFVLLAIFVKKIYKFTSVNDYLESKFGKTTKQVAVSCSIIGLIYFAGWEIAVTKSSLQTIFENLSVSTKFVLPALIGAIVVTAVVYITVGGRKANSIVDTWLNFIKFALLGILTVAAIVFLTKSADTSVGGALMPKFSAAIAGIGLVGFITNFFFNFVWQFVDNTSWQAVSSVKNTQDIRQLRKPLVLASIGVFVAYLLGTIFGACLRGITDLTSDNILGAITNFSGGMLFAVLMIILLSFSAVSLLDGVSLSVSQSFLVDTGLFRNLIQRANKRKLMFWTHAITIFIGIIAAFGVQIILQFLGGSIFDFVYILIIPEISVLGCVLVGLILPNKKCPLIYLSILVALPIGILCSIFAGIYGIMWLVDAAALITASVSVVCSVIIYLSSKGCGKF